jgi:hypothetical protein
VEDDINGHEVGLVEIGYLRKCAGDKEATSFLLVISNGAGGRTRTDMSLTSPDFESGAYTNFATPASREKIISRVTSESQTEEVARFLSMITNRGFNNLLYAVADTRFANEQAKATATAGALAAGVARTIVIPVRLRIARRRLGGSGDYY